MKNQKLKRKLMRRHRSLLEEVRNDHIIFGMASKGHCLIHALEAANIAVDISPDEETAELVWITLVLHNTDHIFGEASVEARVHCYLNWTKLNEKKRLIILDNVLKHGKHNSPSDSRALILTKNADMIANMKLSVVMRSAQFRPNLPPFDPQYATKSDPQATFKHPRTILQNLKDCLKWYEDDWIRGRKSRAVALPIYLALKQYVDTLTKQLENSGMTTPNFPKWLLVPNE